MTHKDAFDANYLKRSRQALALLGQLELGLGVLIVLFITGCIVVGVFFRYVLGSSLVFVEESVTIAFIWTTFLGAAVATKMRRHIIITSISGAIGPGVQRYLDLFSSVFVFFIAIFIAYFATQYIEPQNRSLTVSLPVNIPRAWVFSIPTIYAMASIALSQLLFVVDSVVRLTHPRVERPPLTIMGS